MFRHLSAKHHFVRLWLDDRKLGFGMKDEGTFCKTLGREAKCDGIPVGWYTICFSIVSKKIPAEYL